MNFLIVGNGFDLAHDLPTSYWHCLNFFNIAYNCKHNGDFYYWRSILWRDSNRADERTRGFTTTQIEFLKEHVCQFGKEKVPYPVEERFRGIHWLLDECITDNFWIEYFWKLQKDQQIKDYRWIDFEAEMTHIVRKIDSRFTEVGNSIIPLNEFEPYFFNETDLKREYNLLEIGKKLYSIIQKRIYSNATIKDLKSDIIDFLYDNLRRLTTAVEIYFKLCTLQQSVSAEYRLLFNSLGRFDRVISFNYTDTFVSYMNDLSEANICHIHGKIRNIISDIESPLVLGINEYLDTENQDKDVDWSVFKKFFQRIFKHSDYKYRGWEIFDSSFESMKQDEINLYIFGHSLDITDGDVLTDLILNGKQTTTTIFYRSNKQLSDEIKNLIKLIGSEQLNKRTRSVPPSIVFAKQRFEL